MVWWMRGFLSGNISTLWLHLGSCYMPDYQSAAISHWALSKEIEFKVAPSSPKLVRNTMCVSNAPPPKKKYFSDVLPSSFITSFVKF